MEWKEARPHPQERIRRTLCAPCALEPECARPRAQQRSTFHRFGPWPSAATVRTFLRPGRAHSGWFMEKEREKCARFHQALCRVSSLARRGEALDSGCCRSRASSPGGLSLPATLRCRGIESQRDSGSMPRVARYELPWETAMRLASTPTGLRHRRGVRDTTPLGFEEFFSSHPG